MAKLNDILADDPTLIAADAALEQQSDSEERRLYLGMSQIGDSCARKLWYSFHWAYKERHNAATIKRFKDGHNSEATQAERLRLVEGVMLDTHHPVTKQQFRYVDHDGHFSGHCDGKITGLLQAPKALHIWEHKSTGEKKFNEFKKIKAEVGEKQALRKWNFQYWVQGIMYCFYEVASRHYLTVSTPGVRDTDSCRTEADNETAGKYIQKAERIIKSNEPLDKISTDSSWFECRWCAAKDICHEGVMPDRTCRTCAHASPVAEGAWHCQRWGKQLTAQEQQSGCPSHAFLPALVPGEIISTTEVSVKYRMKDGSEWEDGEIISER